MTANQKALIHRALQNAIIGIRNAARAADPSRSHTAALRDLKTSSKRLETALADIGEAIASLERGDDDGDE